MLQSVFQVFLFRGKGRGDHADRERAGCRHLQQRIPVSAPFLPCHGAQQRLVTAQLTGTVQLPAEDISQGVEPVSAEDEQRQPFIQRVMPPDMRQFMTQNIGEDLSLSKVDRQDDFRCQQPSVSGVLAARLT